LAEALSCVTNAHIITNAHAEANTEYTFAFSQNPSSLNQSPYDLFFVQRYMVIENPALRGEYKVKTLAYEYNVERRKDRQEIICWHWEGEHGRNSVPHIHVGMTKGHVSPITNKTHIPSGRVSVEDVVAFLIDELGVKPTKHRQTSWRDSLAKLRQLFYRFKTWTI
jgi:hypothetical protein